MFISGRTVIYDIGNVYS